MAERDNDVTDDRPRPPDDEKGAEAVKTGGIAKTDADAEDVTRDTYGFEQPEPDKPTRKERLAEAERIAEEEGMPGVVTRDDEA